MRKVCLILSVVVAVGLMVRVGLSGDERPKDGRDSEPQAYARVQNVSDEEEWTVVGTRKFPVRLQLRGQKMPWPRSYQVFVYVYTNDRPRRVLLDRKRSDVYMVSGGDGIVRDISVDIPFKPGEYTFKVWVVDHNRESSSMVSVPDDPNSHDGFWQGGSVVNMQSHSLKVTD